MPEMAISIESEAPLLVPRSNLSQLLNLSCYSLVVLVGVTTGF
jgi:hypothetical protein